MKKLFSLLLALALLVTVFSVSAVPAQAAGKLKYSYKTLDNSLEDYFGKVDNSCRYPAFKGKKDSIKKINKSLKSYAKKSVASYNPEDEREYIEEFYNNYGAVNFYNTVKGTVAFNNGTVVSVRFKVDWFMGGVSDFLYQGRTYSVKTGKRLKLGDVVKKKYNPTAKAGYKRLKKLLYKKVMSKSNEYIAEDFKTEFNTRKKLNNADFYIAKNGKVIFCYNYGGAVDCLRITLPSKYA